MDPGWKRIGKVVDTPLGFQIVQVTDPSLRLGPREDLLAELSALATAGFGRYKGVPEIRDHAVDKKDAVFVAVDNGRAMGFASIEYFDFGAPGSYLSGIVLAPEYQRGGVGKTLIAHMLAYRQHEVFVLTTQSPIVYVTMTAFAKFLYPRLDGSIAPQPLQELAGHIQGWRQSTVNPRTLVCKDIYPVPLYGSYPLSGDAKTDEYFLRTLCFESGESRDGIMMMGIDHEI